MLGSEADVDVVGQAKDGVEVVEMAKELRPDVVIMDLQMPRQSGVIATREISNQHPEIKIVVLTTFDSDNMVKDAMDAGARAYLLKDSSEDQILAAVREVHQNSGDGA